MRTRGQTLGILGDGQLGRMLAQAAQRLGLKVHGFGQDQQSPLAQVTNQFTCAKFTDLEAIYQFTESCDVVTSEFENVPVEALVSSGCNPSPSIFAHAQDRLAEKQAAEAAGLQAAPFFSVDTFDELDRAFCDVGKSGILKTRRLGYDGKGQWRLNSDTDLRELWAQTPKQGLILEGLVDFAFETSALVARNTQGDMCVFPCGENVHKDGMLHQSIVPGKVTKDIENAAQSWAKTLAQSLDLVGLLALEFFVCSDGSLIFNEMAPRPHNSGHWTMEGCDKSQFDIAIAALMGWPLIPPVQVSKATMTNILGAEILQPHHGPKVAWHDYGKADPKPGRKMGHVTETY